MGVFPSISLLRLVFSAALMLLGWGLASNTMAQADDVGVVGKVLTSSTVSAGATVDAAASELDRTVDEAAQIVSDTTKVPASDPVTASTTSAVTTTVRSVEPTVAKVVEPVRVVTKTVVKPVVRTVEPVTESVVKPVVKTVEPVTEMVVKPVVKTVEPIVVALAPVVPTPTSLTLPRASSSIAPSVGVPATLLRDGSSATVENAGDVVDRVVDSARADLVAAAEGRQGAGRLAPAMSAFVPEGEPTPVSSEPVGGPGPLTPARGQLTPGQLSGPGSVGAAGHGSADKATAAVNADLVGSSSATPPSSGEMWMSPSPAQDPGSRPD